MATMRNGVWPLAVAFLLFGAYGIFLSQKIPINGGQGWDGALYVEYIREWPEPILSRELPPYYLRKTFVPAALHYVCSIQAAVQGIPMRELPVSTILAYFDVFNFLSLGVALVLIWMSARTLLPGRVDGSPGWALMWIALNAYVARITFYYPALLDTFAFMLGALLLFGHARKKAYLIGIAMVLGFFTHPFLFIMGALLLVWPERIEAVRTVPKWVSVFVLAMLAGACAMWLHTAYANAPAFVRPAEGHLVWVSGVLAVAFLVYVVHLSGVLPDMIDFATNVRWRNLGVVAVLYAGLAMVVKLAQSDAPGWGLSEFLRVTGYDSLQDPLIFVVAHTVFFGPGVLVVLMLARRWRPWLGTQAGGLRLVVLFMLVMMLNNESRQLVVLWPFASLLALQVVGGWESRALRLGWVVVALAWSRVWLDMHPERFVNANFFEFPAQYYFMHQGPWMSVFNYYWQAAVSLVLAGLVHASEVMSSGRASGTAPAATDVTSSGAMAS